ncbi:MAG TPA: glycosyltransferase family 4 protein [Mycobacteriales bacterium]|nr:glycosyltransferase family 4 protein [Mycobacteriales bacterium]
MKIAHVTDFYLPRLGGIEVHVHDLAARQRAAGHEVHVLTASPGELGDAEPDALSPAQVLRVTEGLRRPAALHPVAPLLGARSLAAGGYDVVHAHAGVWSPLAFIAGMTATRRAVPAVVTFHSLLSWASPIYRGGDLVIKWSRTPVHWTAVSEVATTPLRRLLPPGTEVGVLPNAVEVAAWQVPPAAREPYDVLAVAVMRLAPRKRPLALLRTLRRVHAALPPHVRLRTVVVGEGPERASLERYLRRYGMTGLVSLPGRQTRAQIRDLYRRADVFLAPAHLESFGIAALEARCAGVPVVAMAHSGIRDFVTDGVEGLLVSSDAEMGRALLRLAGDPELLYRMAAHNRSVAPAFGWPDALARTEDAYQRAAERVGVELPSPRIEVPA